MTELIEQTEFPPEGLTKRTLRKLRDEIPEEVGKSFIFRFKKNRKMRKILYAGPAWAIGSILWAILGWSDDLVCTSLMVLLGLTLFGVIGNLILKHRKTCFCLNSRMIVLIDNYSARITKLHWDQVEKITFMASLGKENALLAITSFFNPFYVSIETKDLLFVYHGGSFNLDLTQINESDIETLLKCVVKLAPKNVELQLDNKIMIDMMKSSPLLQAFNALMTEDKFDQYDDDYKDEE